MTDAYIFPSNHANAEITTHVDGTKDQDLIDFDNASLPAGTGLSKGNCGHENAWGSASDTSIIKALGAAATELTKGTVVVERTMFKQGTGNKEEGAFGIHLNTTAWLGYSYNLFYVRTTRCQIGDTSCKVCGSTGRRLLEANTPQSRAGEPTKLTLQMTNPKYIMDPAAITGDFSQRAEYDPFSSAVAVALFGLVSMLF